MNRSAIRNGVAAATLTSNERINILRDPPKSIHTRRIDKVGETSGITQMIDEGDTRACEAIKVFARGVNPSVSVSYSNNGTNGGQSGSLQQNGGRSAYMPRTVIDNDAFRPPMITQEMNYPLSRMPRNVTMANTNPVAIDYSKVASRCQQAAPSKTTKLHTLKASIRPTAVYKINPAAVKPYEVRNAIQDHARMSAHSGFRPTDITQLNVEEPTKGVTNDSVHAWVDARPMNSGVHVEDHRVDTSRYMQDALVHNASTNVNRNIGVSSIENVLDLSAVRVNNNMMNISYTAPVKGYEANTVLNNDIQTTRNLPEYSAQTNIGQNIYKNSGNTSVKEMKKNTPLTSCMSGNRSMLGGGTGDVNKTLPSRLPVGGYEVPVGMPLMNRIGVIPDSFSSTKHMLSQSAAASSANKFSPHI
jgi:hypothetical protein